MIADTLAQTEVIIELGIAAVYLIMFGLGAVVGSFR
jgi:hypothetical protein